MNLIKSLASYFFTLAVFLFIDFIWLAIISKSFYQQHIGPLLTTNVNYFAAISFYLIFVFALLIFVVFPSYKTKSTFNLIIKSLLFGLVTYATYDLTNLATLKNWPLIIALIDLLWGMFISLITSLSAYYFLNKFDNKEKNDKQN